MDELIKLFGSSEQLWGYIQQYAGTAGREATRMVLELYYVVRSPETSLIDKSIIVAALGYQLLPEDLMSTKKFGWLGLLDNGAALGVAYYKMQKHVTPEIKAQVNAILNQWFADDQQVISGNIGQNTNNQPNDYYNPQPQTVQTPPNFQPSRPGLPAQPYDDDEDVVID